MGERGETAGQPTRKREGGYLKCKAFEPKMSKLCRSVIKGGGEKL